MLFKVYQLLCVTRFLNNVYDDAVVANKIAVQSSNVMSRSTAYRQIKKAVNLGLLNPVQHETSIGYELTEKGYKFLEGYRALPI